MVVVLVVLLLLVVVVVLELLVLVVVVLLLLEVERGRRGLKGRGQRGGAEPARVGRVEQARVSLWWHAARERVGGRRHGRPAADVDVALVRKDAPELGDELGRLRQSHHARGHT